MLARKFHEDCNEYEANILKGRKRKPTKKMLERIRYNAKFMLDWYQIWGAIDWNYSPEEVTIAIKRYRSRYES